jgi:hypothetical protein
VDRCSEEPSGHRQPDGWFSTFALFGVSLSLRLLYVLSVHTAYFFHHLQTEPLHYDEWATAILGGAAAPAWPLEQSPGYPYFVAAVYALCGRSVTAVALVQSVLDALTCVLIAMAARTWFGRRVGLIAGLLAAGYGPFIYFTGELLPATLMVFVTMVALVATLRASQMASRGALWRGALAGCLWDLAVVVRAETVLGWPLVWVHAWRRGGRQGMWQMAVPMGLLVAAFITINAVASHRLLLFTTSAGVNVWLGNNPDADGVNPFVFGPLQAVASTVRAEAKDPVDLSHRFMERALSFWYTAPGQAVRLAWKKFLWTWINRELPNTSDIDWQISQSWMFRWPLFPFGFGGVLPFAVAGALLLGRRWRELALLAVPPAIAVGTALLFFTNARFRLIMVPTLLILAAQALDQGSGVLRHWRHRQAEAGWLALGVSLGLLGAWGNFDNVRAYRIPQISVNTGVLEREAGDPRTAVRYLREGLEGDPYDTIGWIHLALAVEQLGYSRAALQAYFQALALVPDDHELREMAVRFAQRHGLDPGLVTAYATAPDVTDQLRIAEQAFRALTDAGGGH